MACSLRHKADIPDISGILGCSCLLVDWSDYVDTDTIRN